MKNKTKKVKNKTKKGGYNWNKTRTSQAKRQNKGNKKRESRNNNIPTK